MVIVAVVVDGPARGGSFLQALVFYQLLPESSAGAGSGSILHRSDRVVTKVFEYKVH